MYKAQQLQPDFIYPHREFVYLYLSQGEFDKAREHSRKALSMAPDEVDTLIWAGDVELYAGDLAQARTHYDRAMQLCSEELPGITCVYAGTCLGAIHWKEGKRDVASEMLGNALELAERLISEGDESRQLPYYIACINAVRGKKEDAFSWLEKAIDAGWRDFRLAMLDPLLDSLRDDEQFKLSMAMVKGMIDQMRRRVEKER